MGHNKPCTMVHTRGLVVLNRQHFTHQCGLALAHATNQDHPDYLLLVPYRAKCLQRSPPPPSSPQDFSALAGYMGGQTGGDFLSAVSDFHLLFFLLTSDVTGLRPHLPALCQAVRDRSRAQAEQWRRADWWATVEQLILASGMMSW